MTYAVPQPSSAAVSQTHDSALSISLEGDGEILIKKGSVTLIALMVFAPWQQLSIGGKLKATKDALTQPSFSLQPGRGSSRSPSPLPPMTAAHLTAYDTAEIAAPRNRPGDLADAERGPTNASDGPTSTSHERPSDTAPLSLCPTWMPDRPAIMHGVSLDCTTVGKVIVMTAKGTFITVRRRETKEAASVHSGCSEGSR
ncbi:hypothetical protein AAFF_G00412280 [Aldrovandia affinis]|uniref:Uncharacterized protein n=1 Tax=Aldrovandia affinis TaxID=143900 RepID=A0AAD7SDR4_9TELE|nr:hypothetical protein AAFF_G00412280 [Aldrovandia affinis]